MSLSTSLGLGAELARLRKDASTSRPADGLKYEVGRAKPSKIRTWKQENEAKSNAGVRARQQRDLQGQAESISEDRLLTERLTAKAAIYDQLVAGGTGGMSKEAADSLSFDVDAAVEARLEESSDEDESLHVPRAPIGEVRGSPSGPDDRIVDCLDEFGRDYRSWFSCAIRADVERVRMQSEMPPEDRVIWGEQVEFPMQTLGDEAKARMQQRIDEQNPLATGQLYYDPTKSGRAQGAGSVNFGQDEVERRQKQANLQQERADTEMARADHKRAKLVHGAAAQPSASTSAPPPPPAVTLARSAALDERRRQIAAAKAARKAL